VVPLVAVVVLGRRVRVGRVRLRVDVLVGVRDTWRATAEVSASATSMSANATVEVTAFRDAGGDSDGAGGGSGGGAGDDAISPAVGDDTSDGDVGSDGGAREASGASVLARVTSEVLAWWSHVSSRDRVAPRERAGDGL
jgi:hypothetical protein